jgi:thymidylate synthase (FAD)
MKFVEPKVFVLAFTNLCYAEDSMYGYFNHIGVPEWPNDNLRCSNVEGLVEIASRSCYKSFGVGLNANITKVREGNKEHLENVIKSRHGSVLEHSSITFAFCDVSRVFTHELVRHRAGVAISQESLRYVRLTELKAYKPDVFNELDCDRMKYIFEQLEREQQKLAEVHDLNDEKSFATKKKLTSAMRRLAPLGLATNIIWTANMRVLRHVIPLRTHESAEEEIRKVFKVVGQICKDMFPNIFFDMELNEKDEWTVKYEKV